MGKKKFINKKKSATFQLYARDSSDPNYAEMPGSDRVFVRVDNNPYSCDSFFVDDSPNSSHHHHDNDSNSIFADAPDDIDDSNEEVEDRVSGNLVNFVGGFTSTSLPEDVRREILELGFPDDGYNYLIHLRDIKNTGGGSAFFHNPKAKLDHLPRDVRAYDASRVRVSEIKIEDKNDRSIYSVAEKTVGVRVQKVVDPEVAALLDDSDLSRLGSDIEDLEEDFVVRANLPEEREDLEFDKKLNLAEASKLVNYDNKCVRTVSHQDDIVGAEQRVRRPLDDQFDMLECQEYGTDVEDDEYGGYIAGEDESLADKLNHALNDSVMDGSELGDKYEVPADLLHGNGRPTDKELLDSAADVIRRCREYGKSYENEDEDKEVVLEQESSSESELWDCETIISTYSNLDNHPAKIEAPGTARKKKLAETAVGVLNASSQVISLRGKEKLPVDFLPCSRKTAEKKIKNVPGLKTEQQKRKQHGQESKEEKKERKAAVKEERREARRVKKEMKGLYQCEAERAKKAVAVAGPSSIHLL